MKKQRQGQNVVTKLLHYLKHTPLRDHEMKRFVWCVGRYNYNDPSVVHPKGYYGTTLSMLKRRGIIRKVDPNNRYSPYELNDISEEVLNNPYSKKYRP